MDLTLVSRVAVYKLTTTNRQQFSSQATFCYGYLKCALPALPMSANTHITYNRWLWNRSEGTGLDI